MRGRGEDAVGCEEGVDFIWRGECTGLSDNRGSNIYPRSITGQILLNHVRSAQTDLPTRAIKLSDIPSVWDTKFPIGLVLVVQLPNYRCSVTYS